jgi:hypothetical protein
MSTRDTMELKEETIRAQYEAALGMVLGFDHAPRLAKPLVAAVTGGAVAGYRRAADVPVHRAGDGDTLDGAARRGAAVGAG